MIKRTVFGIWIASFCIVGAWNNLAFADFTEIGEFTGTHSEDYDEIQGVSFQTLNIMEGLVTLTNLTDGGAIKIEPNSTFNSDLVLPKSAPQMMGQLGILKWEFEQGVTQFGSYFENNSGTDDAVIEFFDANENLMATFDVAVSTSAQQWVWNGWESDDPFSSIVVTGNSDTFLNGFIWYDDTQVTIASVPEPSLAGLAGLSVMFFTRRRRNVR